MSIYTLRNKNRELSLLYNNKKYVVVFKRLLYAHNIQYNIDIDCKINILNISDKKNISNISGNMMLSIPKCKYEITQEYFYIKKYERSEMLNLPNYKDTGLLVPYIFEDETDNEFLFRTLMIDP